MRIFERNARAAGRYHIRVLEHPGPSSPPSPKALGKRHGVQVRRRSSSLRRPASPYRLRADLGISTDHAALLNSHTESV